VAEVYKTLVHLVPEEVDLDILVAFVGFKVSQLLLCEAHDPIPDIEAIAMSGEGYVDAISISFPSMIENSTIDLPMDFVFAIAGLENSVVVQSVLGYGFPQGIMPHALLCGPGTDACKGLLSLPWCTRRGHPY
jgi:hypothetical protein